MFVQGHQRPQARGRQFVNGNRRHGVAERVRRVARHKGSRLRLGVGNQDAVQIRVPVPRFFAPAEIHGTRCRPFPQPLVEGMLRFVAVAAQDALARTAGDTATVDRGTLSKTFHLKLLQPKNHRPEPFVVRQEAVRRHAFLGVAVTQEGQNKRQVVFSGRIRHVRVHGVRPREKLPEDFGA